MERRRGHRRASRGAARSGRSSGRTRDASARRWSTRSPSCTRRRHRAVRSRNWESRSVSSNGRCAAGRTLGAVARPTTCPRWRRSRAGCSNTCLPTRSASRIVHGDFKLDNILLDPLDVGRLVAIFDWEMSALGDPLVDLGILLAYWAPDGAAWPARRRPDRHGAAGLVHAPRRSSNATRERSDVMSRTSFLRDVCAVQDRRGDPADLLPLLTRPDRRSAICAALTRAWRISRGARPHASNRTEGQARASQGVGGSSIRMVFSWAMSMPSACMPAGYLFMLRT